MNKERVYAQIDLDAARYNMESMHRNLSEGTMMAAVVKADAYGHGACRVSRAIEDLPYLWGFAVATVDEALELRTDGRKKPILILGISFEEQFEEIVDNDIRPAICSFDSAKKLSKIAVSKGKICNIHIKLDTGMSRIGFQVCEESEEIIADISKLPGIRIEGIFTHFARADETDKSSAKKQLELFCDMTDKLEKKGIKIPIRHCSNSAGIIEIKEANLDMVRAGITLYGLWPSDEVSVSIVDLLPVMSMKSHISFIKELPAGRAISYGGTYIAPFDRRIATIPVGYADGYSRGLSNKGYVLIHGQRAPIRGRVCMDQFMVDVSDIPEAKVGDEVTLLGKDGNDCITLEQLGEISGRFNYEFACLITPRVPRVYQNTLNK